MQFRRCLPLVALLALASCAAPAFHPLVAGHDALRTLVGRAAPAGWASDHFDDGGWARARRVRLERVGDKVFARSRFDAGPRYAGYRTVALLLSAGAFVAYLNGARLDGGAHGSATLSLPRGLLRASGNVLAIEVAPADVGAIRLRPELRPL